MEFAPVSTNQPELANVTTAYACGSSSFPAAISDFQRGALSYDAPLAQTRFRNPADLLMSPNGGRLPARGFIGSARLLHSSRLDGSRRLAAQSIAHHELVTLSCGALHLNRLSSSLASRWIDPNENGLTHAQRSFAPGAKAND